MQWRTAAPKQVLLGEHAQQPFIFIIKKPELSESYWNGEWELQRKGTGG
jgi:hypothetical protein